MKIMTRTICVLTCLMTLAGTIVIAQDASPLVRQINNGNWLDDATAQSLLDELYYQRAIHVYMTMLPALNVIGMRDGSEKEFGSGYNVLPIWKNRMDSRTWVPTVHGSRQILNDSINYTFGECSKFIISSIFTILVKSYLI